MPYLEMKRITKHFPGVKALSEVDFSAEEGEIVALLGENGAGKSTLMNVLGGVISCDSGEIIINGEPVNIRNVRDAQNNGIAFIHQELSLFPQLTVQENLFADGFIKIPGTPFLNKKLMHEKAMEIIKIFGMDINPKQKVSKLSMGQQQLVEIASAVLKNFKILILDEPTTSLTEKECTKLFEIVRKLKSEKKIIILITHDIERAILESDKIFVQKDGKNSGYGESHRLTKEDVIQMMIGDKAGKRFQKTSRNTGTETVLEFKNVYTEKLHDINLTLKKGEILGMYGLIGSGRTELIHTLFGLDKMKSGEIWLNGEKLDKLNPYHLIKNKVAYLTENRRDEGLFLEQGINKNISITGLDKITDGILKIINRSKEVQLTREAIDTLSIAVPNEFQLVGKLSGGNQQKVVIGKWLHINPDIFILDEPTRGIDVGAKSEIYSIIDNIAKKGMSVILISSEIEEILGMSDRVVVMANGRVAAELTEDQITKDNVIKYTMS